jgi:hypothetical protein
VRITFSVLDQYSVKEPIELDNSLVRYIHDIQEIYFNLKHMKKLEREWMKSKKRLICLIMILFAFNYVVAIVIVVVLVIIIC